MDFLSIREILLLKYYSEYLYNIIFVKFSKFFKIFNLLKFELQYNN